MSKNETDAVNRVSLQYTFMQHLYLLIFSQAPFFICLLNTQNVPLILLFFHDTTLLFSHPHISALAKYRLPNIPPLPHAALLYLYDLYRVVLNTTRQQEMISKKRIILKRD